MKKCSKCKIEKRLKAFSKNRCMKDGLHNECKLCKAERDCKYQQTPEGKANHLRACRKHRKTKASKESYRKYRLDNPEKAKARSAVSGAIRSGRLVRPDFCEGCFQEKFVHGHHSDYDKYLDVDWLCIECHIELHKELVVS